MSGSGRHFEGGESNSSGRTAGILVRERAVQDTVRVCWAGMAWLHTFMKDPGPGANHSYTGVQLELDLHTCIKYSGQ